MLIEVVMKKLVNIMILSLMIISCSKKQEDDVVVAAGVEVGPPEITKEALEYLILNLPQMGDSPSSVGSNVASPVGEELTSDLWLGTNPSSLFYTFDGTPLSISEYVDYVFASDTDLGVIGRSTSFLLASCLVIGSAPKVNGGIKLGNYNITVTQEFIDLDVCGQSELLAGMVGFGFDAEVEAIENSDHYDYKMKLISDTDAYLYFRLGSEEVRMLLISDDKLDDSNAFSSHAVLYNKSAENPLFIYQYVEFNEDLLGESLVNRIYKQEGSAAKFVRHHNIAHSPLATASLSATFNVGLTEFPLSITWTGPFLAPYNGGLTNANACVDEVTSDIVENKTNECTSNDLLVQDSDDMQTMGLELVNADYQAVITGDYSNSFPMFDGTTIFTEPTGF